MATVVSSEMPSTDRMRHLTTVQGSFHGRVLAARLGAEGILVQLRGVSDGPYPLQRPVEVLVEEDQLALAREVLLGDAVDDAVDDSAILLEYEPDEAETLEDAARARRRVGTAAVVVALALVVVLVVVGIVNGAR